MPRILDPQYGNDFVGRGDKIDELKEKIKDNGFIIVTGDRGIGKTNLTLVVEEALNEVKAGFLKKKPCYHVNGSFFYEEVNRIFAPSKRLTGVSGSVSTPIAGAGGGLSWNPREHSILEYMAKSKDKIVFVENAHELKKEDFEIIFDATRRNDHLRFILEIATPYLPDVTIRPGSYEVVQLSELSEDAIEKIVRKECTLFSDAIVLRIVKISKGYPYVARSLAYICDNKDSKGEISQFLQTLRDEDMEHNLDRIHEEVLETLNEGSREVIKSLAIAPETLTLNLIAAFCGDDVDAPLADLIERGILVTSEEKIYRIYHPLFREYLRAIQPLALRNKHKLYREALDRIKSEVDSVIILFEVLNEPDVFKTLIKVTENYDALHLIGLKMHTWSIFEPALCAWDRLLEKATGENKEWEAIAATSIGVIYRIQGALDKALEYQEKALKLNEKLDNKEWMATALREIGIIYNEYGELDKALEYHLKALKLDEEMGRKGVIAADYDEIGVVYREKRDFDKALEYQEKALKLGEDAGNNEGIANAFGNLGNIYRDKGELDKALEYFERALKLNEKFEMIEGIANQLVNKGTVYGIKGELDKALKCFEKALKIFRELGARIGTAQTLMNVGTLFAQKGDKERALDYYFEAQDLVVSYHHPTFELIDKRISKILKME
jgi:tetratricopeptide (TPR) repeat protein